MKAKKLKRLILAASKGGCKIFDHLTRANIESKRADWQSMPEVKSEVVLINQQNERCIEDAKLIRDEAESAIFDYQKICEKKYFWQALSDTASRIECSCAPSGRPKLNTINTQRADS